MLVLRIDLVLLAKERLGPDATVGFARRMGRRWVISAKEKNGDLYSAEGSTLAACHRALARVLYGVVRC